MRVGTRRGGNEPALSREAAEDSRAHKSGVGVGDLRTRWHQEVAELGWTVDRVRDAVQAAARDGIGDAQPTITDVLDRLSTAGSTWSRADVTYA